jgi:DNA-binding beta-propeller fold protein YncE
MKRYSLLIALLAFLVAGTASGFSQAAKPTQGVKKDALDNPVFKLANKYTLGGEGGWDYLTYDPDGDRVFVSHGKTVIVVDAASGKVAGEIPANGVHGIALVPGQGKGFISNGRGNSVTVFDLKTLQPVGEIPAGTNPDAIVYDPHSKMVLVMNGRSKDLMVLDPAQSKIVATIPLGGKLEFAATDAGHAYVNVEDTGEIAVIDSKAWTVSSRVKLDGCEEPSGLAIDEANGYLFAVCGNKVMKVVSTRTGKVVDTLPTGNGTDAAGFGESGGIGRRTRLRIWRSNPWGFESPLSHQYSGAAVLAAPLLYATRARFPERPRAGCRFRSDSSEVG